MTHSTISRRSALTALGAAGAVSTSFAAAAATAALDRGSLERASEDLRRAMVAGDGPALDALLHDRLAYIHSSGKNQSKPDLLGDLAGKRFFASLAFPKQAIEIVGDTGMIVQTVDQVKNLPEGGTRASRIEVLQTWVASAGGWKLLNRMSAIISSPLTTAACSSPAAAGAAGG